MSNFIRKQIGETKIMDTKKKILKVMDELPENVTVEDAMEKLYFLYKIEKGIEQADKGQKIEHQKVKESMKKWLE